MAAVAEELRRIGGGMAISGGGRVDSIPLDIAGLMSSLPPDEYIARLAALTERADAMGVARGVDAFMSLSFLALPVIPSLKLTDRGLFDVDDFAFTSVDA